MRWHWWYGKTFGCTGKPLGSHRWMHSHSFSYVRLIMQEHSRSEVFLCISCWYDLPTRFDKVLMCNSLCKYYSKWSLTVLLVCWHYNCMCICKWNTIYIGYYLPTILYVWVSVIIVLCTQEYVSKLLPQLWLEQFVLYMYVRMWSPRQHWKWKGSRLMIIILLLGKLKSNQQPHWIVLSYSLESAVCTYDKELLYYRVFSWK